MQSAGRRCQAWQHPVKQERCLYAACVRLPLGDAAQMAASLRAAAQHPPLPEVLHHTWLGRCPRLAAGAHSQARPIQHLGHRGTPRGTRWRSLLRIAVVVAMAGLQPYVIAILMPLDQVRDRPACSIPRCLITCTSPWRRLALLPGRPRRLPTAGCRTHGRGFAHRCHRAHLLSFRQPREQGCVGCVGLGAKIPEDGNGVVSSPSESRPKASSRRTEPLAHDCTS